MSKLNIILRELRETMLVCFRELIQFGESLRDAMGILHPALGRYTSQVAESMGRARAIHLGLKLFWVVELNPLKADAVFQFQEYREIRQLLLDLVQSFV